MQLSLQSEIRWLSQASRPLPPGRPLLVVFPGPCPDVPATTTLHISAKSERAELPAGPGGGGGDVAGRGGRPRLQAAARPERSAAPPAWTWDDTACVPGCRARAPTDQGATPSSAAHAWLWGPHVATWHSDRGGAGSSDQSSPGRCGPLGVAHLGRSPARQVGLGREGRLQGPRGRRGVGALEEAQVSPRKDREGVMGQGALGTKAWMPGRPLC